MAPLIITIPNIHPDKYQNSFLSKTFLSNISRYGQTDLKSSFKKGCLPTTKNLRLSSKLESSFLLSNKKFRKSGDVTSQFPDLKLFFVTITIIFILKLPIILTFLIVFSCCRVLTKSQI